MKREQNISKNLEIVIIEDTEGDLILIQGRSKNFEKFEKIWVYDGRRLQAFERVFYGKDSIIYFTKLLHYNPRYEVSAINKYGDPEIRFLRSDIAVVH